MGVILVAQMERFLSADCAGVRAADFTRRVVTGSVLLNILPIVMYFRVLFSVSIICINVPSV